MRRRGESNFRIKIFPFLTLTIFAKRNIAPQLAAVRVLCRVRQRLDALPQLLLDLGLGDGGAVILDC